MSRGQHPRSELRRPRAARPIAAPAPRALDERSELVVLNNDCVADERRSGRVVRRLADPRARVLELPHRGGVRESDQRGNRDDAGDVVFFANSDLFVSDGYVDEMLRFVPPRPRVGAATGKILRYDIARVGKPISSTRLVTPSAAIDVSADRGENEKDIGQYGTEEKVFGVSGAALVARREALESVKRPRRVSWTKASTCTRRTSTCAGAYDSPDGSAGTSPTRRCVPRPYELTASAARRTSPPTGVPREREAASLGVSGSTR